LRDAFSQRLGVELAGHSTGQTHGDDGVAPIVAAAPLVEDEYHVAPAELASGVIGAKQPEPGGWLALDGTIEERCESPHEGRCWGPQLPGDKDRNSENDGRQHRAYCRPDRVTGIRIRKVRFESCPTSDCPTILRSIPDN
jgi:hypothetical protein